MTTTKNVKPVVEHSVCEHKEDHCCCCDSECKCGCQGVAKTILLCGTMLVSAAFISAAILLKPCPQKPHHMPMPGHKAPTVECPAPVVQVPAAKVDDAQIRDFIMKNPKVLIDSVDKYYKAEEGKAAKAAPKERPPFDFNKLKLADAALVKQVINDKTNYSLGNPKGKFVIIEFFDYQCGWCKRTNKGMEEAIASAEGKNIRWIPIDTPIFGENSERIARYVLAAGEQGKYAEMHKAVGEAKGKLDEAGLLEIAKGLKLDVAKLQNAAEGEKIKAKLESNNEFRKKLNISGVPMLIVDGRINPGALIEDNLKAVVKLSADKK